MTEWELSGSGRRRLRLPLPNLRASRRAGEGSRLDGFGASRDSGTAAATPSTAAATAATAGHGSPTVLFVLPYTEPAGTERHVLTLARELLRRGWRVGLVAPPGGLLGDFLAAGVPHYPFPRLEKRPLEGVRAFRRALAAAVRQAVAEAGRAGEQPIGEQPRVLIHVHGAHELVLLSRTVARARRLPIVFTVHGYASARPALDYRLSAWMANRFADRVICVSRSEAERLTASGLRPDRLRIVHNGIEPFSDGQPGDRGRPDGPGATSPYPGQAAPPNRETFGLDPEAVVVGAVGRLELEKGFDCLINAFARAVQERSAGEDPVREAHVEEHTIRRRSPRRPRQLALVGSGSQEGPLRQLAQAHGLKEGQDVVFLGFRHDARAVMQFFDILAVPSRKEAFGLVVIEAMACGLPVVATQVGGIPEIVIDGRTGLLVPADNPEALGKALAHLVRESLLRRLMGEAAYHHFRTEFTADRMATRTLEVYQALLPAPPPARPATPPEAP